MKIKLFLLLALFVCSLTSNSQQNQNIPPILNRGCGTPVLPQQFETWVQGLSAANTNTKLSQNQIQSIFNIPVIVHVIHNNEAVNSPVATTGGNLNVAQIIDQINILNKDYNGLNADTSLIPVVFKPRLGKFQFNFCLAVVNPTGGILAEPGVDRINRVSKAWTAPPYSQAYVDATVKPNSIWNPNKYMNIWVCAMSGGILGFATFPAPGTSGLQGLSPPYGSATTDGVVIASTAFGSIGTAAFGVYNKGRTATHEVGHWLSLRHIWGDGTCVTDYCNDTPPAQNANYNCPSHPYKLGVCTGNTTGEMFMDYMDYTNDACMYMFTNDQKNRAQLIMTNSPLRLTLLTSTVCSAPTVTNDIGIMYVANPSYSQAISCNNVINPSLVFFNYGNNVITSATLAYNVDGINAQNVPWTGTLAPSASVAVIMPQITNLSNGPHSYNVGVSSPNGGNDPNMQNNYSNQPFSIVNSFTMSANGATTLCPGNTATLTANGTASGYTWTPGLIVGTVAVVSPVATTIYTLSGNSGTCINTRTVAVNVSGIFYTINSPGTICAGSSATVSASGAISYSWSTSSTSSSIVVSPPSNTSYSLSLSNGACNANTVINISVMPSPTVTISSPSGSICIGSSATLTASGAASYSWNGGPIGSIYIVSPTVSTIYSVIGTGSVCSGTNTFALIVGPSTVSLTISASQPTFCSGSSVTIAASGAASYLWNTGANVAGIVVTPSATAAYTVTGTTGACTAKSSITVTMISTPILTLTVAPTGSLCPGGTATITASGAGSYSWNTGSSGSALVVSPTVTATYTAIGSNSGCVNTKTISVAIGSSSLSILINPPAPAVCTGGSITLLASGANTYTWNTGSNSSGLAVTPTVNTVYSVTGINGACSATAAVTVSVVAPPVVSIGASPSGSVCAGTAVMLTAAGANSYTWNVPPSGVISPSLMVTPTSTSIYTVTGSNQGCSVSQTMAVTVGPGTLNLSVLANPSSLCAGKSSTISATGANSYSWSTGSSSSIIVVTPTSTSSYSVTGSLGGCTGSTLVTVSVVPAPPVTIGILPSDSICPGKTATLTANGQYSSYAWTGGSTGNGASIAVSPASTSSYAVLASGGGCSVNASAVVFVRNTPASTLSATHPYCDNQCGGMVNATSSGGLAPYSYNLTVTNCTVLPCTNLCPGLYTLYTKDAAGCASFNIFSITCKDVTGIKSNGKDEYNLQIYPNPATNNIGQTKINIELQGSNFSLAVYNGLGQLVISTNHNYNKAAIDIDRLAKGVYIFEVNTGSEKLVRKVVVY